jgi:peptidoglycan/xylan/chitin deacetylase (PgdA/CDA1 family)
MNFQLPVSMLLLAAAAIASSAMAAQKESFAWPEGRKAAVSLAYDDALDSQLDNAIPALDKFGLKGSFYLALSRDPVRKRMAEWRAAAANGHELGNHTLFHQCSASPQGREWVEPQRNLDNTTAAQMKDQVLLANVMLNAIDGKQERTMTVPCGDVMAAGQNYVELVESEFVGIKLGSGGVTPRMSTLDPSAVTVEVPVEATGKQLIEVVEAAARQGTMANFTFHGIGGDYLTVSNQAHQELLAYLAGHRDVYWVDTFVNLMKYVRSEQAAAEAAAP